MLASTGCAARDARIRDQVRREWAGVLAQQQIVEVTINGQRALWSGITDRGGRRVWVSWPTCEAR